MTQHPPQNNDDHPVNKRIQDCDLSVRVMNMLARAGIHNTDELAGHWGDLWEIPLMTTGAEHEIVQLLTALSYSHTESNEGEITDEELEKRFDELFNMDNPVRNDTEAAGQVDGEGDPPDEGLPVYSEPDPAPSLPPYVQEVIDKEEQDLADNSGSEAAKIRRYLDWVLSLPWQQQTQVDIDMVLARTILNQRHFGLAEVKERILEFLAVQKLTGGKFGAALLLAGPPGVGKTSIAKSIAEAMQRKFVKVSLGGVNDEMMIRGCDRAYTAAQPGDILRAIRQCGTLNPVMLLDEIDKIGHAGSSGDVSAALLEMLDSERSTFKDHYLSIPVDLSGVLFIATANDIHGISPILKDRLHIIEIDGYTVDEKLEIARKYVLPDEEQRHGLPAGFIHVHDDALMDILQTFSNEPGVRNVQHLIQQICSRAAYLLVSNPAIDRIDIDQDMIGEFLGRAETDHLLLSRRPEVGVANALGSLSPGRGLVLPIEVGILPGRGRMHYTGNLMELIRESAELAVSIIRGQAAVWQIEETFHETRDIHFHLLDPAVPKDGASLGAALLTALVSALAGIPVRSGLAMTGEITLRGRLMPVKGLEEKLTMAYNAGIQTAIIPEANAGDLPHLPERLRQHVTILTVSDVDQLLEYALVI